MNDVDVDLAALFRERRKESGKSLEWLSQATGLTIATLWRMERGYDELDRMLANYRAALAALGEDAAEGAGDE